MMNWSPEEALKRVVATHQSLLVMNKPAGIPTSGRRLSDPDCLQYWLMEAFGQMVWAVHQIDADTSGVNLFVLEKSEVARIKEIMALTETRKVYRAIVDGVVEWDVREVHAPIGMVDERSLGVTLSGKAAESRFRVLARGERSSLLEVEIKTGRTHQIRIHLAHLGHPLLGEEWYGPSPCARHPRQALHALSIEGPELFGHVPLADDLRHLLACEGIGFEEI